MIIDDIRYAFNAVKNAISMLNVQVAQLQLSENFTPLIVDPVASDFAPYAANFATGIVRWGDYTKATTSLTTMPGWTYSRTDTSCTATALDLAGNVVLFPARTNFIRESQDVTISPWSVDGTVTRTANAAVAPDGTLTADRVQLPGAGSALLGSGTTVGNPLSSPVVFSFWAKGVSAGQTLGLRSGQSAATTTRTLTTEWQRFTWAFTSHAAVEVMQFGNGFWVAGASSTCDFHVWGVQLEAGTTASAYIPTAGSAVTAPSSPRITSRGLLVEEARTNIWETNQGAPASIFPITSSATVGAGSIASPGAGTVVLVTTTGTNGRAQRNITVANDSLTRAFQIFLEKKSVTYSVSIGVVGGSGISNTTSVNGTTGVSTGGSGVIVESAGLYWRVILTVTNNASGNTTLYGYVDLTGASGLTANVALPDIQTGSVATSPIITTGAAGTRGNETVSIAMAIPVEGTMVIDYVGPASGNPNRAYGINIDDGGNDRLSLRLTEGGVNTPSFTVGNGTSNANFNGTLATFGQAVKVGFVYSTLTPRTSVSQNGSIQTSATQLASTGLAGGVIGLGQNGTGFNHLNSYITNFRIFPYTVTDTQLQAFTV